MSSEQRGGKSGFGAGVVVGAAVGLAAAGIFISRGGAPAAPGVLPAQAPAPSAAPFAQQQPAPAMPQFAPSPSEPAGVASPREAADQLFNQAMIASEQGQSATVAEVAPRAIAAYEALGSLDNDGRYHLAALHLANKEYAAARKVADGVLSSEKSHLLALSIAAQAAAGGGDNTGAAAYWQRLDDSYDAEAARQLPEYVDHHRVLPSLREKAKVALGK
jgi:hypothetical protein